MRTHVGDGQRQMDTFLEQPAEQRCRRLARIHVGGPLQRRLIEHLDQRRFAVDGDEAHAEAQQVAVGDLVAAR